MKNSMSECRHSGQEVQIGKYTVLAGAGFDIYKADLQDVDILIALTGQIPWQIWLRGYRSTTVWSYPIQDYYGPVGPWKAFLKKVIKAIKRKKRVFIFCDGGHGRTGLLLASLITLMERKTEDPIAAVRSRYCQEAIETIQQARSIFSLRRHEVPDEYKKTLKDADLIWEEIKQKLSRKKQ